MIGFDFWYGWRQLCGLFRNDETHHEAALPESTVAYWDWRIGVSLAFVLLYQGRYSGLGTKFDQREFHEAADLFL